MHNRLHRPLPFVSAVAAAAVLLTASTPFTVFASGSHGGGPSLTINAQDKPILSGCDEVKIRFSGLGGSWETVRSTETISVPRAEASPLRAGMTQSGGMRVQPWDRADYEVEVCKAATGKDLAGAQKILDEIRVARSGGTITSDGPEPTNRWTVFLIVRVPRGASLDLETHNGGIDVRGVEGTIVARSQNGPIQFENCSGHVRAHAQNGPVAVDGGSGKYHMSTQNGPVAVALSGKTWEGAGLSAETANGPIALTLAPDFSTGIRIHTSGSSPFVCTGPGCSTARKSRHEGGRTVTFGESEPIIRLKTANGPIAVESTGEDDESEQGVF